MTRVAHEISVNRLNRRLVVSNPHDELGRLATTLNDMMLGWKNRLLTCSSLPRRRARTPYPGRSY